MRHSSTAVRGTTVFARYAFPPNELGYCGPDGAQDLLGHGPPDARPADEQEITRRAKHFDGAWSYLTLIAAENGISDPLDPRVVEAYWVGNSLLTRVRAQAFAETAQRCFGAQYGAALTGLGEALAHHSFHVFEVYPWVGLLRSSGETGSGGAGAGDTALSVLERCRIRSGEVVAVHGERATVRSRPLCWRRGTLRLGTVREEYPRWQHRGRSLQARPLPGQWVSMHWDWVCDRLSEEQHSELEHLTLRQLALTNRRLE